MCDTPKLSLQEAIKEATRRADAEVAATMSDAAALDAAGRRAAAYVADRLTAAFDLDPTVVLVDYNAGTVLVPVDTLTALLDAWDTTAASRRAPTACTSCGSSLARCDSRISRRLPACCIMCARTDTHNDTPSGYADRMRARGVEAGDGPAAP